MTLSNDEFAVLLIAREGEPMIPIGRWKPAVERLVELGYLSPRPSPQDPTGQFNCVITPKGREAAEKRDQNDQDDFANAVKRFTIEKTIREMDIKEVPAPPSARRRLGPHVIQGRLFFQMSDASSISCTCIGEPFASQIVAMWTERGSAGGGHG